ncbi:hypothetical protein QTN25_009943 [Entamoeba marina]
MSGFGLNNFIQKGSIDELSTDLSTTIHSEIQKSDSDKQLIDKSIKNRYEMLFADIIPINQQFEEESIHIMFEPLPKLKKKTKKTKVIKKYQHKEQTNDGSKENDIILNETTTYYKPNDDINSHIFSSTGDNSNVQDPQENKDSLKSLEFKKKTKKKVIKKSITKNLLNKKIIENNTDKSVGHVCKKIIKKNMMKSDMLQHRDNSTKVFKKSSPVICIKPFIMDYSEYDVNDTSTEEVLY